MATLVHAATRFVISRILLKFRDMPIAFQDERMSTRAVESAMVRANLTRAKRAARRDALAACWILQSALDALTDNQAPCTQKDVPPPR